MPTEKKCKLPDKYEIKWLDTAKVDYLRILDFVSKASTAAARRIADQLKMNIQSLEERPRKFPRYPDFPFLRKMVVEQAVVFT